jgi:hypothetical protein
VGLVLSTSFRSFFALAVTRPGLDGADFKGSIEIDRSAAEEADKNVSSRAAAAGAGPKSS